MTWAGLRRLWAPPIVCCCPAGHTLAVTYASGLRHPIGRRCCEWCRLNGALDVLTLPTHCNALDTAAASSSLPSRSERAVSADVASGSLYRAQLCVLQQSISGHRHVSPVSRRALTASRRVWAAASDNGAARVRAHSICAAASSSPLCLCWLSSLTAAAIYCAVAHHRWRAATATRPLSAAALQQLGSGLTCRTQRAASRPQTGEARAGRLQACASPSLPRLTASPTPAPPPVSRTVQHSHAWISDGSVRRGGTGRGRGRRAAAQPTPSVLCSQQPPRKKLQVLSTAARSRAWRVAHCKARCRCCDASQLCLVSCTEHVLLVSGK